MLSLLFFCHFIFTIKFLCCFYILILLLSSTAIYSQQRYVSSLILIRVSFIYLFLFLSLQFFLLCICFFVLFCVLSMYNNGFHIRLGGCTKLCWRILNPIVFFHTFHVTGRTLNIYLYISAKIGLGNYKVAHITLKFVTLFTE